MFIFGRCRAILLLYLKCSEKSESYMEFIFIALTLWLLFAYICIKYMLKLNHYLATITTQTQSSPNPVLKIKNSNIEQYLKNIHPNLRTTLLMIGDPECFACKKELEELIKLNFIKPFFLFLRFNDPNNHDFYVRNYGKKVKIFILPEELIKSAYIHTFPMYILIGEDGKIVEKIVSFVHLKDVLYKENLIKEIVNE